MNRAVVSSRIDAARARVSPSPARRVWQRFRQQRLGYWSFVIFFVAFAASVARRVVERQAARRAL